MGRGRVTRRRSAAFEFIAPSERQLQLMTWWSSSSPFSDWDGVIADGSIRAGKTVAMIDSFVTWSLVEHSFEDFIIGGRTVGSLKRNVLKPLFQILRAKGLPYHHHRSENWIRIGTNRYYLFGGSTEASQDDLAGMTAAGALVEEATRLAESFVNECVNRCSVEGSKIFFNCNPKGPKHWFKEKLLDQAKEKKLLRLHFTLDDNPALSQKIKDRYRRMFSGVWFKRYILGLWVAAEGVVYPMFSEDEHVTSTKELLQELGVRAFPRYIVGMDHGTQASPTTFGLYGLYKKRREDPATGKRRKMWHVHKLKEYRWSGKEERRQKTNVEYVQDYKRWIEGFSPQGIYVDPSAADFRAQLKKARKKSLPADNDVENGIQFVASMLSTSRYTVDPGCKHTIEEFLAYVWDPDAQDKGEDKPLKENDHHMDGDRYAIYTHLGKRKSTIKTGSAAL